MRLKTGLVLQSTISLTTEIKLKKPLTYFSKFKMADLSILRILTIFMLAVSIFNVECEILADNSTIVVTAGDLGKIKGFKVITNRFLPYYNFAGIPYGKSPAGAARFKVNKR